MNLPKEIVDLITFYAHPTLDYETQHKIKNYKFLKCIFCGGKKFETTEFSSQHNHNTCLNCEAITLHPIQ